MVYVVRSEKGNILAVCKSYRVAFAESFEYLGRPDAMRKNSDTIKASLGANWKATITAGRGVVEITKHSLR